VGRKLTPENKGRRPESQLKGSRDSFFSQGREKERGEKNTAD